jgi:hypothetical protein
MREGKETEVEDMHVLKSPSRVDAHWEWDKHAFSGELSTAQPQKS